MTVAPALGPRSHQPLNYLTVLLTEKERKQHPSPVPCPGHALAFSSLKPLLIRRRGCVTAVNGMFLHSGEV